MDRKWLVPPPQRIFPRQPPSKESLLFCMWLIESTISIRFQHRVFFTRNVFGLGNPLLKDVLAGPAGSALKALVVIDESLHDAQPALSPLIETYFKTIADCVELVCPPLVLEGGERVKNSYFHVSEIQSHIDRYHIDRHSCVLAVGGGALLDLAGLAAATAHRGVRHLRIPTTTLSQADSGVGVKNGINAFGKKNFIGTFAVPWAVINDFDLLASLSPRRGGRRRHCAGRDLLTAHGFPERGGGRASAASHRIARLRAVRQRAGPRGLRRRLRRVEGPRGISRAPGRPADDHIAARHRAWLRGQRRS